MVVRRKDRCHRRRPGFALTEQPMVSNPHDPGWRDHLAVVGICIAALAVIAYYRVSRLFAGQDQPEHDSEWSI